nr:hypothetical protein [Prauserella marina]
MLSPGADAEGVAAAFDHGADRQRGGDAAEFVGGVPTGLGGVQESGVDVAGVEGVAVLGSP